MDNTNEFSFLLKTSTHGVGVFAAHDIKKGSWLRLFAENNPIRLLKKDEIPLLFRSLCADRGDKMIAPPDFGYMPIGWYLNHSNKPNAIHDENEASGKYGRWLAARDIMAGEEITIYYNRLDEPEEGKQDFYSEFSK